MKKKMKGVLGIGLALVLVLSLMTAFVPADQAQAQAFTANRWNAMPIPSGSGLILNDVSDVVDFAVTSDGTTIYLVDGTDVFKSTNGGRSFSELTLYGGTAANLVAVAPDDVGAVAVVDVAADKVYISKTGGATWVDLGVPWGTLSDTEVISGVAVSPVRAGTILDRDYVVCTYDTTGWGDIYVVGSSTTWSGIASGQNLQYDFTSLALAPNWVGERVVIAVGSDATAAGNAEVGACGDTYLVSISANPLSPGLKGPQLVNLDTGGNDSPAAFGWDFTLIGAADWNTDEVTIGSYSVKLTAGGDYVQFTPAGGITVSDLEALTNEWSFWYHLAAVPGPQLELKFTSTTDDGWVDITLMPAQGPVGGLPVEWHATINEWHEVVVASDLITVGVYGVEPDGTTPLDQTVGGQTLTEALAYLDTQGTAGDWSADSWELTRVQAQLWEAGDRICYIDDITIDGKTYRLEVEAGEIVSSSVALPSDFDSTSPGNFRAFVGWTSAATGNADDVYRVDWSSPRKLEIRSTIPIESLSYSGTAQGGTLFAGESQTTGVWFTTDPMSGMPSWGFSYKPPTGATNCKLQVAPDFESSNVVWGGAVGANSAFSKSEDGGFSFNGISFIDTDFTAITDVMPTPDGSYIFMATDDGSLWRCPGVPASGKWDRVGFAFTDSIVRISPDADAVYWFDVGGTSILKSTNDGQIWGSRTAAAGVVDATVESQDILYTINDSNAYKSTNGGWSFGLPNNAGISTLDNIAMAPSYPQKPVAGNVLVGAGAGAVALSTDGASTFTALSSFIATGAMKVLADKGYADNNIVYAASTTVGEGIWRYEVGVSAAWEQIDAVDVDENQQMTGLVMEGGLLYGSWATSGGSATSPSGAERMLAPFIPVASMPPTTTMDVGATTAIFDVAPTALRVCGTATDTWLYAIDTADTGALLAYSDTMAKLTPELTIPSLVPANPVNGMNEQFTISWPQISNANEFLVRIYTDEACTNAVYIPDALGVSEAGAPKWLVPRDKLIGGKYWCRVLATDQVPDDAIWSNWSAKVPFSVEVGLPIEVPYGGPQLMGPLPGATDVSPMPGFGWAALYGAEKYEFELSASPETTARGYFIDALVGLTGENALVTTAWQCTVSLDYETNYYWHVKAITATSESPWSTAVFTTISEAAVPVPPAPPVELPAPITPGWIWAIVIIGGILVIVVIVLIVVTRKP